MSLDVDVIALEQQFWANPSAQNLTAYQAASRARELARTDARHRFIVVIPVADRPQQLSACLDSLHQLGQLFGYGGQEQLISVLIADDSLNPQNMQRHRQLAAHYATQGLATECFGLEEQAAVRAQCSPAQRAALTRVLGVSEGGHKGATATRNLVYLKLAAQIDHLDRRILCYFIDSDQTFQVRLSTQDGERDMAALDYFYQLDRIFSTTDTLLLTGKVVGDPPVSPSVMAANFLADVQEFLHQVRLHPPQEHCRFHALPDITDEAAYHDMASLFGFANQREAFSYACPLCGLHTHADTLTHFASQLNGFFYGEHPTRKSRYQYQDALASLQAARTVYTGNYCFRPEALRYFVPFADLRLRMAGPVLGRILKSELSGRFVSANLPMLHARTLNANGALEFRPGVAVEAEQVNLSGEQERQFYGDVMLFCIEKLLASGYPQQPCSPHQLDAEYQTIRQNMASHYAEKRALAMSRLSTLQAELTAMNLPQAVAMQFQCFMDNIVYNFAHTSPGYALIEKHAVQRKAEMLGAIEHYFADRAAWEGVLYG